MKSVFISDGQEIRLECPHEGLIPGAQFTATLTVTNRSQAPREESSLVLDLCYGSTKDQGALEERETLLTPPVQAVPALSPGASHTATYHFELDVNCPVSEKQKTPFLYFGVGSAAQSAPLTVSVQPFLQKLYELLESSFQFVYKSVRSAKGWSEAKFKPSAAPRFSLVEELTLASRIEGETLRLVFRFRVKRFSATASAVEVRKEKSENDVAIPLAELLDRDGNVRYEFAERVIAGALESVASGV